MGAVTMVQPTPIPSTLADPPQPPAFSCPSPDARSASSAWYTRGKPSRQLPARMSGDAASKPSREEEEEEENAVGVGRRDRTCGVRLT